MSADPPIVAHFASAYYRLSENWIHTQVMHLARWRPVVLSERLENVDRTAAGAPPYVGLADLGFLGRLRDRLARRLSGVSPSFLTAARGAGVVHAHFGPAGWRMLPLARRLDAALVTTFYGYDLGRLPRRRPEWSARYAELFEGGRRFLVEGSHMADQLEALGCPRAKIRVQHLGIDRERFPLGTSTRTPEDPLRILLAGRFVEKKGFPDALRAFAAFRAAGGKGRVTVIGAAGDDPGEQAVARELDEVIARHELTGDVELRGFRPYDELLQAYYEHDVLLSPSLQARDGDNEGGAPVTLIEASAAGLPAVSTRHCDIPEVVRAGETGLLTAERDIEALAGHLGTLAADEDLRRRLGRAAHEHMAASYDARAQGQALDAIYDEATR